MEGFWGYEIGGQIFGVPSTWRGYGNEKFQNRNSKEGCGHLRRWLLTRGFNGSDFNRKILVFTHGRCHTWTFHHNYLN